jgi:MYXO-CTERM domain-containing protein
VSVTGRLAGAGAVVMALCCAVLPLAGAALGGSLIASTGTVGIIVGGLVLIAVVIAFVRRRRSRSGCGC